MKKYIKIISIVVVLAIISGVVYYAFRKSPDSVKNMKPDYIVETSVLVDEFINDENNANQKYLDKILQIQGEVMDIQPGVEDKTTIFIKGSEIGNISCLFTNTELKKTNLKAGSVIKVKGKCSGFTFDVVLTKCALLE